MSDCITITLTNNYSGCLVEKLTCVFAHSIGFSFRCTHPDHKKFNGCMKNQIPRSELATRYDDLREARKSAFMDGLGESERTFFADTYQVHESCACSGT